MFEGREGYHERIANEQGGMTRNYTSCIFISWRIGCFFSTEPQAPGRLVPLTTFSPGPLRAFELLRPFPSVLSIDWKPAFSSCPVPGKPDRQKRVNYSC